MISKNVRRIFRAGVAILILLVSTVVVGVTIQGLPILIKDFTDKLYSTFYWTLPLVFFIFIYPYVQEISRMPDIQFRFSKKGNNLYITVINNGDTKFSFNRVQFYIRRLCRRSPRITSPKDGKVNQLWFRKAGETTDYEMREEAGCTVERGIPLIFWMKQKDICEWLSDIREKAPSKSIFCRIYFYGTHMKAKSKQPLETNLIEACLSSSDK